MPPVSVTTDSSQSVCSVTNAQLHPLTKSSTECKSKISIKTQPHDQVEISKALERASRIKD